jgi:hypothetical protein
MKIKDAARFVNADVCREAVTIRGAGNRRDLRPQRGIRFFHQAERRRPGPREPWSPNRYLGIAAA